MSVRKYDMEVRTKARIYGKERNGCKVRKGTDL